MLINLDNNGKMEKKGSKQEASRVTNLHKWNRDWMWNKHKLEMIGTGVNDT